MKKNKVYTNRIVMAVHLLLLATVWLLPASCSQDEVASPNSGEEVSVKLSLSVADMQGESAAVSASTRASVPTSYGNVIDESTIQDLWVFQFVGGTFIRKEYLPAGSFNKDYLDVALSKNVDATTSNLYFVANAGPSAFNTPVTTETAFQTYSSTIATEGNLFPLPGYMPMIGQLSTVSIPSGFAGGMQVKLTRMLARVDLSYTVSGSLLASGFQLSEVKVCNVSSGSYYYAPAEGSNFPATAAVTNFSSLTGINGTTGTGTFYLPDNRRGTGTNSSGLPTGKGFLASATYLQFSGIYQNQEVLYNFYLGADDLNDYNLVRNHLYPYSVNLTGSATDSRVQKNGASNCYMVKPGESVKIPVKRANQSDLGMQLPDLTTGWTAEVIWRDNSFMTLTLSEALKSKGMFEISTNAGYEGNALVCIKDDSGNILWSWHIWVTGYDPSVTNHSYNSLIWMDRNLGAQNTIKGNFGSLGYLYQWGRKDPFAGAYPAAAGTTTLRSLYSGASGSSTYSVPVPIAAPTTSANNLQNSVRNPSLFYFKASSPYDWYLGSATTTHNDALWGATKTVYDPCPQGWKVPANGAWPSTLTTSTSTWDASYLGRTITATSAWYPANGYRHANTGALTNVGANGYYWSSTVYSADAYYLYINSSYVYPSNNHYRSFGFGLRCVQE